MSVEQKTSFDELLKNEAHQSTNSTDTERRRSLSTRRSFLVGSMTGLAIASLGIALNPVTASNVSAATNHSDKSNEVSDIASELADRPIRISCDDEILDKAGTIEEDGRTFIINGQVFPYSFVVGRVAIPVAAIREGLCDTLLDSNNLQSQPETFGLLRVTHYDNAIRYAQAVATLIHESEHTNQVFDEAAATCYAYQKLPAALEDLGMDTDIIPIVTKAATARTSDHLLPSEYYSDECKPGGELDLAISDIYISAK